MPSLLPFVSGPFARIKRKMSGQTLPLGDVMDGPLKDANITQASRTSLLSQIDFVEVLHFVAFILAVVSILVLGVTTWVLFFFWVVDPDDATARAQGGGLWMVVAAGFIGYRQLVRRQWDAGMTSVGNHAEIFVTMSLAMVFAINIAFYLHVPSNEPLADLGFMLIPEQSVNSKWRPVSDLLTAGVPVIFLLQTAVMKRANRCRVISAFFRLATVSYFLRMLTISLTILPGPAPHCRKGHASYHPPENWIDIVTRVGPMYGDYSSCGDLIFSGHLAYTTSAVLLYLRVLDRHVPSYSGLRWTVGMLYLATLSVLCISGRKHYTVDVVLGLIIATLSFFHFEHGWTPVAWHMTQEEADVENQRSRKR